MKIKYIMESKNRKFDFLSAKSDKSFKVLSIELTNLINLSSQSKNDHDLKVFRKVRDLIETTDLYQHYVNTDDML